MTLDGGGSAAERTLQMVGKSFRMPDFYEVGREKVREYAKSVQNDHPVHYREDAAAELGYSTPVAPVTFISVLGLLAQKQLFETLLTAYDFSQMMQADQRQEFTRPIFVGDRLTVDVHLDSLRQMGGSDTMVIRIVANDTAGEHVMTMWTTLVARSETRIDPEVLRSVKGVVMHDS